MLFVLTTVMLLMTGCIRENMDDCKGKVTLRFRYVGDGTTNVCLLGCRRLSGRSIRI